jgi:hypothetical protein
MLKYHLLQIEAAFMIIGRGLVLIPNLHLPKESGFKQFLGEIEVSLPDGEKKKYSAQFILEHYNFNDGIGHWKITILLPNKTKSDFPDGCEVYVSEDVISRLQYSN